MHRARAPRGDRSVRAHTRRRGALTRSPERRDVTPLTPFHLGPGALLKAAWPERVSLTAFACVQVVIDAEPLFLLIRRDWPTHRLLHTGVGATAAGLLVGLAVHGVGRRWLVRGRSATAGAQPEPAAPNRSRPWTREVELGRAGALAGGLLGGVTHSLVDALNHPDVRPFWPLAQGNALLGLADPWMAYLGCLAAGITGMAWLAARRSPRKSAG